MEYMEQENVSSSTSLSNTEPGFNKNLDDNNFFTRQAKKCNNLTKTTENKKKKINHFNESIISMSSLSEMLSNENSNEHDNNYTTNEYNNDHTISEDNYYLTNE